MLSGARHLDLARAAKWMIFQFVEDEEAEAVREFNETNPAFYTRRYKIRHRGTVGLGTSNFNLESSES